MCHAPTENQNASFNRSDISSIDPERKTRPSELAVTSCATKIATIVSRAGRSGVLIFRELPPCGRGLGGGASDGLKPAGPPDGGTFGGWMCCKPAGPPG